MFKADICNPIIGSVLQCIVINTNKFGILTAASTGEGETAMEIIIAKQGSFTSEVDLNTIRIGDKVGVEIIGKRYDNNDSRVSGIGRIVKSSISGGGQINKTIVGSNADEDTINQEDIQSDAGYTTDDDEDNESDDEDQEGSGNENENEDDIKDDDESTLDLDVISNEDLDIDDDVHSDSSYEEI